ncbi:hypothetical protein UFOVP1639_22 [uncultured Caudovirales phage]|uniref:Uncharacterized protein n=1 Tax=uncultured Caudovirales phage TaxID=2100421 RepID=A0A6J5SW57_9CAUD|nr:hypothetical protein UFOVP1639_22 [uncultured Caudovirales phage]
MATGTFGFRADSRDPIKITGLSEVQRNLRKLSTDALDLNKTEFLETNKQVAEIVINETKKYVPFLTGALAAAIRNASTKKSAKVRAGNAAVPYAGPIHFGWPSRSIKPNTFLYEAIDARKSEVANRYAELVSDLILKYDLG